jgi:hypothetical protein
MIAMAPAERLVTAVDPHQIPDPQVRKRLRASYDGIVDEPTGISPWLGTGMVVLLSTAAMAAAVAGLGALAAVLVAAAATALVGFPAGHLLRRIARAGVATRRLDRWRRSSGVVTAHQQRQVAKRAPELGERLARAGELTGRLRRPREEGGLGGVLPGVDDDALDRIHHRIVVELTECVDLAEAVAEASRRPNLAALVAARRAELAAACEEVDARLAQLSRLAAAAEAIADQLDEARLAERLTAEPAPAAALRLPEPASGELPDLVAAADTALELYGLPAEIRSPDAGTSAPRPGRRQ